MTLARPLTAELIGTFWLVFGGCGSAVLAAAFPGVGIGLLGVSFAFGLTVLTMAYAIGHISGCHLNPAVSIGLAVGGRFRWPEVLPYVVAQVAARHPRGVRAVPDRERPSRLQPRGRPCRERVRRALAWRVLTRRGSGRRGGADDDVPAHHSRLHRRSRPARVRPIAIGLGLTLIHLIGIPVTNLSVNPARSTGPAMVTGGWALAQLWMFWVAPIVGAVLGALVYGVLAQIRPADRVEPGLRPAPVGPVHP